MSDKIYERVLKEWASEFRKKLPERIRRLIKLANTDLYFGPISDGSYGSEEIEDWPGFSKAVAEIRQGLHDADMPGTLYIDCFMECYQNEEPNLWEQCVYCDGSGTEECELGSVKCIQCNGNGGFDDDAADWCKVEHSDLLKALVGTELAPYLR
jgi:hypothetical protein